MESQLISSHSIEKQLPEYVAETFRSDASIVPITMPAVNLFYEWFQHSGTPFFRHYTDHSAIHSLDVFKTGVEFVSITAQRLLSARDLSYFLLACFCHDAGMHLTETQFSKLINPNHTKTYNRLDIINWPTMWVNFYEEAKRFNQRTLEGIFGDTNPLADLPSSIDDYTDRHRRLIGEFIRRNHPRLAHDLALGLDEELGLPKLLAGFKHEECDLIGLIARSHGEPLRTHYKYIEMYFDLRDFNRAHIIFLMAMLRLADYAQLQASRAPLFRTLVHPVASPISQQEWRVHASIKNITTTHDDPHAIYIDANPGSVADYLRLKEWLDGLQSELDICWAVFGEIYGRQTENGLSNLGFFLRRVRSSLSEKKLQLPYVPEKISFKVAEAEMLSLLLAPLYGNNPGYGVRELIQNAVDAVEEALTVDGGITLTDPSVQVDINIKGDKGCLIVMDNGVGMTLSVINSYFLNAGASFRSSLAWKREFVDASGKAKVVRNGRFGVGALAAFLVGSRISVSTRHRTMVKGLSFDAALHDSQIEIREKEMAVGTVIKIDFKESAFEKLKQFFHIAEQLFQFKSKVNVICNFDENDERVEKRLNEKFKEDILLQTSNYSVGIKIKQENYLGAEIHYVNGIAVAPIGDLPWSRNFVAKIRFVTPPFLFFRISSMFSIRTHSIHLLDRNGVAPLNLARDQFTQPEMEVTDAIRARAQDDIMSQIRSFQEKKSIKRDTIGLLGRSGLFYFNGGVCPIDVHILQTTPIRKVYNLPPSVLNPKMSNITKDIAFSFASSIEGRGKTEFLERVRSINLDASYYSEAIIFARKEIVDFLKVGKIPQWLSSKVDTAETVHRNGTDFKILKWGTVARQNVDAITHLTNSLGIDYAEYFEFSAWNDRQRWSDIDKSQTELSRHWIENFSGSNSIFYP